DLESYQKGQSMFYYSPERVDYEANPVTAYDRIFGGGAAGPVTKPMGADFTNEALDIVSGEMDDLGQRLVGSASEIKKLATHRQSLSGLRPSAQTDMGTITMPAGMGPLDSVE